MIETQKLQHSNLIYGLSILALLCCCFAGFGALPAGIAYYLALSELNKYYANPEMYTNQDNIYTGKIIALVALAINILYFAYTAYSIYTIGWDVLMEQSQQMMGK